MKKLASMYFFFTFILVAAGNNYAQDREGINEIEHLNDGTILLADFEKYNVGTIPQDWYNQKGEKRPFNYKEKYRKDYKYVVQESSGNKYLHYEGTEAKHLNFPLVNKKINIYDTPIFSWKWRISDIPDGADEDNDDLNDAAASIYVVFDFGRVLFKKVPKSIRYTWSSSLEKGEELSKFFGNQKIVVMGTGSDGIGEWQTFNRNIVEDYKRLFGDTPPKTPLAILILSDGDDTQQRAVADYDDLMLKPETTAAKPTN